MKHLLPRHILMGVLVLQLVGAHTVEARRRAPSKPAPDAAQPGKAGKTKADDEASAEVTSDQKQISQGKTLANRIRAVTGQVFERKLRFSVGPLVSLSFNDPFYQNYAVGANVGFHITETLYIGITGEYVPLNLITHTVRVMGREQERPSYYAPHYYAYLTAAWAPFYGKISLMAEKVLHFDFYVLGGAGVAGMKSKRDDVADPPISFSVLVGIGGNIYTNRWISLRWEIADRILSGARYIGVIPGTEKTSLQHFFGLSLGVDFYFPRNF